MLTDHVPIDHRRTLRTPVSAPASRSRRYGAAASAALLVLVATLSGQEKPHRRLTTQRFEGPAALNNRLGAFFPHLEELVELTELYRLLSDAARRNGLSPNQVGTELSKELLEELLREQPGLMARVPELLRQNPELLRQFPEVARQTLAGFSDGEFSMDFREIAEMAESIEGLPPPMREAIQHFGLRAAVRAAGSGGNSAFREGIAELRRLLEGAGVPPRAIDSLRDLYRGVSERSTAVANQLRGFTRDTVGRLPSMDLPSLVLPAALIIFAAAALGCFVLLRQRTKLRGPPPPVPDFKNLAPRTEEFTRALLALYRRVLFHAETPFAGKPVRELRDAATRFLPDIAEETERLNAAFYELWYAGAQLQGEELAELNTLLARVAATAQRRGEV